MTFEGNRIDAVDYGVFVEANISGSTLCDPLNYKTSVKSKSVTSTFGGGTGLRVLVAEPSAGFTPMVSYATFTNNTVTGFDTCLQDDGGVKTKNTGNTFNCSPIAIAPARAAIPQPATPVD